MGLVAIFPGLARDGYRETSQATWNYNCIAWAASRSDQWWEPDPYSYSYWPPGVARQYTLQAYEAAYRALGFEACADGEFAVTFEKIVLFADAAGTPTHAARQLENGRWTSKLGSDVDIEHGRPEALIGKDYGTPVIFMRRRRSSWRWPLALVKRAVRLLANVISAVYARTRSLQRTREKRALASSS